MYLIKFDDWKGRLPQYSLGTLVDDEVTKRGVKVLDPNDRMTLILVPDLRSDIQPGHPTKRLRTKISSDDYNWKPFKIILHVKYSKGGMWKTIKEEYHFREREDGEEILGNLIGYDDIE